MLKIKKKELFFGMLPEKLQEAIKQLPLEHRILFEAVVSFYDQKIEVLESRIKELEGQISKNSSNSSKPPSTDGFNKPAPKSLRGKSGLKPGGQKGHKGGTLKMVEVPDKIEIHKADFCSNCYKSLSKQKTDGVVRRQVFDIPPIQIFVTEHQAEIKACNCGCVNRGVFPDGVNHYVQYGPRLRGVTTYLQDYQLLPCLRTKELIKDLFGHDLSTGSLYNIRTEAFDRLAPFEEQLKTLLISSPVAGFDETGFYVNGKRYWLHSTSTDTAAYYGAHRTRGPEAMNSFGILPQFKGIAVHDFWKSYFKYFCTHALCNAHSLRDLIFIKERSGQAWSDEMIDLLLKMKGAKEKAVQKGKLTFSKATLNNYRKQYNAIIQRGLKLNPFKPSAEKKRGRDAKPPPLNLLIRLRDYADDYLRFFYDFKVPFDNNFSERDIRMMKVKQKISGCFRSMDGAKCFARIRSYIVTARKQNVNVFEALTWMFMDDSISCQLTGAESC